MQQLEHSFTTRDVRMGTRPVQPVATCRQSPYLHKPAIVKLLLLIYGFQFSTAILLRIILERILVKTETEIADEQAGFRQCRGTRDQITNLRILMHKAREHQQPLYMCFVDFKKVFDSISHDKLWITTPCLKNVPPLQLAIIFTYTVRLRQFLA